MRNDIIAVSDWTVYNIIIIIRENVTVVIMQFAIEYYNIIILYCFMLTHFVGGYVTWNTYIVHFPLQLLVYSCPCL